MENTINVTNLSPKFPILVTETEYNQYKTTNNKGWSHCNTYLEWLVKLHYLRQGFKEGKIEKENFFEREKELVLLWWKKWC